jgi:hypothetical protein
MSMPALQPYATQQRWQSDKPLPGEGWQSLLTGYLAALARACAAAGPCLIGHIKALALFDSGGYLRVSAVSATHEPTVDGCTPDGLSAVSVTLNVHVYGLPAARLRELAWQTAATAGERSGVQVTEEAPGDPQLHGGPQSGHDHSIPE